MTIQLWHCKDARSLRPLWALEEMDIEYQLHVLPFPPRFQQPDYLDVNPLGTVPFMLDGDTEMTESTGICHYLVEKYHRKDFSVQPEDPCYGDYLNWLYHSDATLTFPQSVFFRYAILEPEERRQPKVAEDYRKWYLARLLRLNEHLDGREFLCCDRFTIADIAIAYALYLGEKIGINKDYEPQTQEYLDRMKDRPAFIRASSLSDLT
jgi:glutathione S-transferase